MSDLRAALDDLTLVEAQLRENGYHDWPDMLARIRDRLAATSEPTLDAAWAETEAALPEGWSIWWLRNDRHIEGGWDACAGWDAARNPAEARVASGIGPTPLEALRALAARLHERTEG